MSTPKRPEKLEIWGPGPALGVRGWPAAGLQNFSISDFPKSGHLRLEAKTAGVGQLRPFAGCCMNDSEVPGRDPHVRFQYHTNHQLYVIKFLHTYINWPGMVKRLSIMKCQWPAI
jgi:hypothetical protein